MFKYDVETMDTYCGEADYSWVDRDVVTMPELTHYGYDGGSNYAKANKTYERELMKKAKAVAGFTGCRGRVDRYGDVIEFRPYRLCQVMFIVLRNE